MAAENVLGGRSLAKTILQSLPHDASPQLKSPTDAVTIAAHACMLAVGFRLVGLGEDHRLEAVSDASVPTQRLPTEWNASSSHAFQYAHDQSSMRFLLRTNKMGKYAVVLAMAIGDDKTYTTNVEMEEFVSEGNLPADSLTKDAPEDDALKTIAGIFITEGRLSDFGKLMRSHILQKLIPNVRKEGYEEDTPNTSGQPIPGRARHEPSHDPLREQYDPPARPYIFDDPLARPHAGNRPLPDPMPGFDDEYETLRPPRPMPGAGGGGFPRLGERDLYPQGLGPHDPIRGGIGPGFGPGSIGGGGMHPTFDDPLFAGQGRRGPGYDSQNPPGSRFDPVGPRMGDLHPRGAGMGGGPPNPFGGFGGGDFI